MSRLYSKNNPKDLLFSFSDQCKNILKQKLRLKIITHTEKYVCDAAWENLVKVKKNSKVFFFSNLLKLRVSCLFKKRNLMCVR